MENEITITIQVPESLHEKLKKIKEETGVAINFQVNKILQEALRCKL